MLWEAIIWAFFSSFLCLIFRLLILHVFGSFSCKASGPISPNLFSFWKVLGEVTCKGRFCRSGVGFDSLPWSRGSCCLVLALVCSSYDSAFLNLQPLLFFCLDVVYSLVSGHSAFLLCLLVLQKMFMLFL